LIEELKRDPFTSAGSSAKLQFARAASLEFANRFWGLSSRSTKQRRLVRLHGLGPYDLAYERAERRA
jgi:hypothetical protein